MKLLSTLLCLLSILPNLNGMFNMDEISLKAMITMPIVMQTITPEHTDFCIQTIDAINNNKSTLSNISAEVKKIDKNSKETAQESINEIKELKKRPNLESLKFTQEQIQKYLEKNSTCSTDMEILKQHEITLKRVLKFDEITQSFKMISDAPRNKYSAVLIGALIKTRAKHQTLEDENYNQYKIEDLSRLALPLNLLDTLGATQNTQKALSFVIKGIEHLLADFINEQMELLAIQEKLGDLELDESTYQPKK